MITDLVSQLGPWSWFIGGLILLIGEIFIPGLFLIWFGIAALVIGSLTLMPFTDVSWWPWQAQVVAFGVLSLVLVVLSRNIFAKDASEDEASRMNDPLGRFIGREAVLHEPIENGVGRVKLGDTIWRVQGPDLPKGAHIKVTGKNAGVLIVEENVT